MHHVPVATTELAIRDGQRGTVSLSVVDPDTESLAHGNEQLEPWVSMADDQSAHVLGAGRKWHHALECRPMTVGGTWRR